MINLTNYIKSTLRPFKLKSLYQAVLSFLAIALLVTTTACNSSEVAAKTNLDNPPPGKTTELYKPITPEIGGMNNYSEVDPRVDTSKVDAKAMKMSRKMLSHLRMMLSQQLKKGIKTIIV